MDMPHGINKDKLGDSYSGVEIIEIAGRFAADPTAYRLVASHL